MRKLILKMSVSADGFVGGPNGEIDWILRTMDTSAIAWIQDTLWQAGVHIMGSHTFYDMAAYWPTSPHPLAAPMNAIPKMVFSKKGIKERAISSPTTQALKDAILHDLEKGAQQAAAASPYVSTWTNAMVASGDLATEIGLLKQQEGKDILAHGGASFARDLVRFQLIDEYRLLVHPVILGRGLPLFSSATTAFDLKLQNSTILGTGIIANIYNPLKN